MLLICTLCHEGVLASQLHTHLTRKECSIRYQADVLRPVHGMTQFESVTHNIKVALTKAKLPKQVQAELQVRFGAKAVLLDREFAGSHGYKNWLVDDKAFPLQGHIGPVVGVRFIKSGVICLICQGDRPTCTISVNSMNMHRTGGSHPHWDTHVGNYYRVGPIQSLCGGRFMSYYPVPGGLPANLALPVITPLSNPDINPDEDSDSAWARVIQRDAEKSLGDSALATEPEVLDEKTLVPFLRDYRIHSFLSEQPRDECLALSAMEGRKVSPRPLRRLYKVASNTFLADCDMALDMNPAVRRLIMHDNP